MSSGCRLRRRSAGALHQRCGGNDRRARPKDVARAGRGGKPTMSKALEGVRILDFTHVQSGPTCTQLLAWFGADVIKVERPGVGDITRAQLRDIPKVDSLYFTMLNGNKRSITLDTKNPTGKEVLEAPDEGLRRAGRELRPRRARPHGLHLGAHPCAQPAADRGLDQGLRARSVRGLQGLRERRAMRRRLGLDHRLRRRPAARHRRADRRLRHRAAPRPRHRRRAVPAHHTGRGQRVTRPCRTAC